MDAAEPPTHKMQEPSLSSRARRSPSAQLHRFKAWFACEYDPQALYPKYEGKPTPSLSLGLDLMRDNLGHQMAQADALDSKAGVLFASSSFVTGVLVAWRKLPTHAPTPIQILPIVALVVYAAVVALSAIAFNVTSYGLSPDPIKLRDEYLFQEPPQAMDIIFHGMVIAWLSNNRALGTKLHWLLAAALAFAIQIVVVAVIITVEVTAINAGG